MLELTKAIPAIKTAMRCRRLSGWRDVELLIAGKRAVVRSDDDERRTVVVVHTLLHSLRIVVGPGLRERKNLPRILARILAV